MMKNYIALFLLLFTTLVIAQKKEKIKGSKTVTIENREIGDFNALEIDDNLDVYLIKGEKNEIIIEADDNLHNIISLDLREKTLRLYTSKEVNNFKKLIVKVTYTNDFNTVTTKNDATITALAPIQLDKIAFNSYDYSKLNLNIDSKLFILKSFDKSKSELNIKTEKTEIELNKNADLKALISSTDLKCDLYQKSSANIEGDVVNAVVRLDNNSEFKGNKLTIKNAELTTESYTNCAINATTNLIIDASGNSKIQLYGDQKIEMKRFIDNVILTKKPTR